LSYLLKKNCKFIHLNLLVETQCLDALYKYSGQLSNLRGAPAAEPDFFQRCAQIF